MRALLQLFLRLRSLFRRDEVERELSDEFAFHLEYQIRENIERGMSQAEARSAALRAFGGIAQLQEECRDMRFVHLIETAVSDVRQAVRGFRKRPGFTIVAVLTLAPGIGASTALFSLVNTVLLRPLPVANAERLVIVWENDKTGRSRTGTMTPAPANFVDWRAQNHTFEDMSAGAFVTLNLTGEGEPDRLSGQRVTTNFFTVLGVQPAAGRLSTAADNNESGHAAVLSYGLWVRRFGGNAKVIGRTINLNGEPYSVTGIAPAGFQFPSKTVELWVAPGFEPRELAQRSNHLLFVTGRLKAGVSIKEAKADMQTIGRRLERAYPQTNTNIGATVVPLREYYTRDFRQAINVLLAAVGALLLIVCANMAHLFLARGSARGREVAMRAALGAGRGRITRQLLTECAVLALSAALLGAALSIGCFHFLARLIPNSFPAGTSIDFDASVFAFTAVIAILTAMVFGLAPALQALRLDLNEVLKLGSGKGSVRGAFGGFQAGVVAAEVALTVLLLIGGSLLVESYIRLRNADTGFRAENVLTLETPLPTGKYANPARRMRFYRDVIEQTRALPGAISAAYISFPPLVMKGGSSCMHIEGRIDQPGQLPCAVNRVATAGYLQTIGIPLLRGRFFDESDGPDSPPVLVIDQAMARAYWPGGDAIGAHMRFGDGGANQLRYTVIGIVGDVREMRLESEPGPEMYFAATQGGPGGPFFWPHTLVVRAATNPVSLGAAIRRVIGSIDPDQPVANMQTMDDVLDTEVSNRQTETVIVAAFAIAALLLASVGLYGVLAYTVAQRRTEIGIRMALGARRGEVVRGVMSQAMRWTVLGAACGLAAAYALTRLLSTLLYDVSPLDIRTFVGTTLLTFCVAAFASFLPARRAASADPLIALRQI